MHRSADGDHTQAPRLAHLDVHGLERRLHRDRPADYGVTMVPRFFARNVGVTAAHCPALVPSPKPNVIVNGPARSSSW